MQATYRGTHNICKDPRVKAGFPGASLLSCLMHLTPLLRISWQCFVFHQSISLIIIKLTESTVLTDNGVISPGLMFCYLDVHLMVWYFRIHAPAVALQSGSLASSVRLTLNLSSVCVRHNMSAVKAWYMLSTNEIVSGFSLLQLILCWLHQWLSAKTSE